MALLPGQYRFGPFTLDVSRSILTEGNRQVRLGSRAMSMLAALVQARGELVTRRQLIERAWPETFVEASNLRVQISAVRRALGDDGQAPSIVVNVASHGYRIGVPIECGDWHEPEVTTALDTSVIGRDREIAALVRTARRSRLVTLTGPGGVGKTTIAAAAAQLLHDQHMMDICFVDFASVEAPELVPATVSAALGLSVESDASPASLIEALRARALILVFDTCEHLLPAVAGLAQALLHRCPDVSVIATSQEVLGLSLERVIRVQPLAVADVPTTLESVLLSPAGELLAQRALAAQPALQLTDADASTIHALSVRLDGLPLAIEIAATNLDVLSLAELLEHLVAGRGLGIGNRRTASTRHQTMHAMLAWTTRRLGRSELRALRRLARHGKPLDVQKLEDAEGADIVTRLIRRSLLVPVRQDGRLLYRMLESTRHYVLEQLSEA